MSLKIDRHSKWNVTQNVMSFKIDCHSSLMQLKMKCRIKWNVTKNEM